VAKLLSSADRSVVWSSGEPVENAGAAKFVLRTHELFPEQGPSPGVIWHRAVASSDLIGSGSGCAACFLVGDSRSPAALVLTVKAAHINSGIFLSRCSRMNTFNPLGTRPRAGRSSWNPRLPHSTTKAFPTVRACSRHNTSG